jgi:hypothetical protein
LNSHHSMKRGNFVVAIKCNISIPHAAQPEGPSVRHWLPAQQCWSTVQALLSITYRAAHTTSVHGKVARFQSRAAGLQLECGFLSTFNDPQDHPVGKSPARCQNF